ncbi:hypothetical protein SELMODRAFT_415615 [Selaginella moellendorffii]|uniref:DDE Tnp4 domain-containing protein n=1 Tax=Selaginella moellendorffii TaxID=88036 RepID=D8RWP7_SELML|nr:hypothetical protein SELMODRAFT_415615 [Selaginella moellendorffii]
MTTNKEVEEDDWGDEEEGDADEEGEAGVHVVKKCVCDFQRKTGNPDYFSLSHKDAKQLMPMKLNLKVFLVEYFNIMDEFLAKQTSTSPTFLVDSDASEEEAHEEDPADGVDPPRDATQVPGSSGKQKNPKKAEKSMTTLLAEGNALATARNEQNLAWQKESIVCMKENSLAEKEKAAAATDLAIVQPEEIKDAFGENQGDAWGEHGSFNNQATVIDALLRNKVEICKQDTKFMRAVPVDVLLGVTLYKLFKNTDYSDLSDKFGIGEATAHATAIVKCLGSVHDMRVFRNSRLYHKIQAKELLTVLREFAFDEWIEPYLVGDKDYQLQQHLMIPHLVDGD